jgi:thiopeptide-type bacteriocin biosynthesis protein
VKTHVPASRFVLRTPLLPFDHGKTVAELIADPGVREALRLASPELDASVDVWREGPETPHGRGIGRALARYALRMAGRATPFGLCAGVSTGTLAGASATRLELAPRAEYTRTTRVDQDHLVAACHQIALRPEVRARLTYFVNTSLYALGARLRYVEAKLVGGERAHHLVELERSDELDALLARARTGATPGELAAVLTEVERDEADGFITELIDAQVLVPELAAPITGSGSAARVAAVLERAGVTEAVTDGPQHVDLYKPATASLGPRVVAECARAVELLAVVGRPPDDNPFPAFRAAFEARYGAREVPLVEVLDEESGIGFESSPSTSVLLAELGMPAGPQLPDRVAWGRREVCLLELAMAGKPEVELSDADVDALARDPAARLHDTLVLSCALSAESDAAADADVELFAGSIHGPALRTLARFGDGTPELGELIRELARADEAHRDAIYAEIVHLPAGRTANVVVRPALRAYEIPYLGASGVDREHQLELADLDVSLVAERVVLRSRRLGREVVPRLSAAHDFSQRGLAVYRFLGALSLQDGTSVQWSWGPLEYAPFLPRVRRGKIVLARARWRLGSADLEPLREEASRAAAVAELRARRGLPRWIAIADDERELPIDLDDPVHADIFADMLKRRDHAVVHELYPARDRLLARSPEGRFVHELSVPFVRREPVTAITPSRPKVDVPRTFPPGSDWFYAKLYSGEASGDGLLRDVVAPLVTHAERWFFLRYHDPDPHVRLRIVGDSARLLAELHAQLERAGRPCWRVAIDTYEREVERYRAIDLAEQWFTADSIAVLAIASRLAEADDPEDQRWLVALRSIDRTLDDLGLELPAKLAHATRVRDALAAELGAGTMQHRRFGAKFRSSEEAITSALAEADDALAARSQRVRPLVEELRKRDIAPAELAADLVHMSVNRLMPVAQRAHELVFYDLLRRTYLARTFNP